MKHIKLALGVAALAVIITAFGIVLFVWAFFAPKPAVVTAASVIRAWNEHLQKFWAVGVITGKIKP